MQFQKVIRERDIVNSYLTLETKNKIAIVVMHELTDCVDDYYEFFERRGIENVRDKFAYDTMNYAFLFFDSEQEAEEMVQKFRSEMERWECVPHWEYWINSERITDMNDRGNK